MCYNLRHSLFYNKNVPRSTSTTATETHWWLESVLKLNKNVTLVVISHFQRSKWMIAITFLDVFSFCYLLLRWSGIVCGRLSQCKAEKNRSTVTAHFESSQLEFPQCVRSMPHLLCPTVAQWPPCDAIFTPVPPPLNTCPTACDSPVVWCVCVRVSTGHGGQPGPLRPRVRLVVTRRLHVWDAVRRDALLRRELSGDVWKDHEP